MKPRKRRLSQQDLRALGTTPGLMAHKVGPDGRARLEEITPEARRTTRRFIALSLGNGVNGVNKGEGGA